MNNNTRQLAPKLIIASALADLILDTIGKEAHK